MDTDPSSECVMDLEPVSGLNASLAISGLNLVSGLNLGVLQGHASLLGIFRDWAF